MRYAIVSKSMAIAEAKAAAIKVGAKDIREAKLINQIFCELTDEQVERLSKVQGISVKSLKSFRPDVIAIPEMPTGIELRQVMAVAPQTEVNEIWKVFETIRSVFVPPITGQGLTVAILDTGIRKTHESLMDKVVYEENFSSSPDASDVFGHGTQVAFVVAGGENGSGIVGVSPGASLMNIKVINNEGIATEEEVVLGIEKVCSLVQDAYRDGLSPTAPMYPNVINLSLGAEDDGDEDSPMRAACRVAVEEYGLDVIASAGNSGPDMTTITSPGTEPKVITVGAIETVSQISIWEQSSRGPTKRGDVKPDFVFWGMNIEAADNRNDNDYLIKSGTSFSCPMLSGLTGLLWETGRRVYGESWLFKWAEARELAPYYCMKPEEAAVRKDNTYGYGLPAVGTLVGRIAQAPSSIEGIITPMILMMMVMSMMRVII